MSEKWKKLIQKLEVFVGKGQETLDAETLSATEAEYKITFPSDYKEFCQVLGSGELDKARVYCPTKFFIEASERRIQEAIRHIERFGENLKRDQQYIEQLRSAFVFGESTTGEYLIFWDLRTYHESDGSYDIYWADSVDPGGVDPVTLGRDLFNFIQNFCYGTEAFDLVPEYMEGSSPGDFSLSFYPLVFT
jgi:SMI1 / KNR4 family (SUKH-1)